MTLDVTPREDQSGGAADDRAAARRTLSQDLEQWPPPVAWCFGHHAVVDLSDELVSVESVMTHADEAVAILRLRKPRDRQEYGVELRLPTGVFERIDDSLTAGTTLAEIGALELDAS